jgi:photosystem II stability/assembly factor-like uncharacterized protein
MNKIVTLLFFLHFSLIMKAQDSFPVKGEEVFNSLKARQIGPAVMSGRVVDLEAHPTNSKIFYVGSAGGGVWKTINGGISFSPVFDKHVQCIGSVKVDPNDPDNTIWVGTGETWTRNSVSIGDGIYKSIDGGLNWQKKGLEKSERISDIAVHPKNSKIVFVGVLGALWGDSDERGIFKTEDGGETWKKIFFINQTTGCSDLIIDHSNPDIMYASFWEFRRTAYSFNSGGNNSALYKSMDGGKSWNKIHNGFPAGKLGRITVAIAPSNPNRLYSVIESEKDSDKGLYRSDDAGQNWKKVNGDFELVIRPFYFSRIVVDPKNPDVLVKAGLFGFMSKDGGNTFRSIQGGIHADFHDFIFDPNNSEKMVVGTDGGVYKSWDGGTVWEMVKGLPLSQFYHVSVDNQKPYWVYGGLQDNGSWTGPSSKTGGIRNSDWKPVGYGDGFRVYPHPTDQNTVYSEMQGAENIWRVNVSKSLAKTIKPYREDGDPKLRFNWNAPLSTSLHNPDRLYVGSQFIHVSDDKGETWKKISSDLTTNDPKKQMQAGSGGLSVDNSGAENHCTVFTINESPIDKNIIWAGTDDGNVQVTFDGGLSWQNVRKNIQDVPENTWTYFIEPSNFDKNTAYVVFDGHTQNDMKPYVQKTTDGGKTWKSIVNSQIPVFVRSVKEDVQNPDILYLGTEWGLFITFDGGMNWTKFENNVPSVAIHYMTIHKEENALIMGTHGRGIIIIDDLTPIQKIEKTLFEKEFVFVDLRANTINETVTFQEFPHVGEYVGDNPTTQAKIVYYMNKRHTFGKMILEVFDDNGNKVADLPPGKSKGLNEVLWNYTHQMPKVAKGKTLTFGGFTAPKYPAGKYKVKMTIGNKVYEQDLILKYSEQSIITESERKEQYEKSMTLYRMTEDLAKEVEKIDLLIKTTEEAASQIKNKKLVKKLNLAGFKTQMDQTKEKMVVMTGDNYVGQAEPRIREKITALYSEIVNYPGVPSNAQLKNIELLQKEFEQIKVETEKYVLMAKAKNEVIKANNIQYRILAEPEIKP